MVCITCSRDITSGRSKASFYEAILHFQNQFRFIKTIKKGVSEIYTMALLASHRKTRSIVPLSLWAKLD